MLIEAITNEQFNEYDIGRTFPTFSAKEVAWYRMHDDSGLGLLLKDNFDKDYSFITFEYNGEGGFSIDTIEVDFEDFSVGESILYQRMIGLYVKDKQSTELYTESNLTVEKINCIVSIDDEIKKFFKRHPEKLYELSPRKFEELIADIMTDLGFKVELTKQTRDGGKDIIASIETAVTKFIMYVECKRHSANNKVDVGIVRELVGVHSLDKPNKSLIITTSYFTPDAVKAARSFEYQVELQDFNDLKNYLSKY